MSQGALNSSRRRTLDCLPGTRRGRIAAGSTVAVVLLACTLALAFTLAPMASTTSEAGTNRTKEPVVVVGGGLAGLSAAIEIVRAGGSVVILEKTDRLGGNSAKASSGINAAGSAPQKAASIEDNPKDFAHDTEQSGRGRSNAELVNLLAEKSASALQFLEDFGIDLSIISQLGGHSHPRTHRATIKDGKPMNVGFRIMSTLIAYLNDTQKEKPERVKILTNARVVKLLKNDAGGIDGVVYSTKDAEGKDTQVTLAAGAVILATGGYSADAGGLLKKHVPYYEGIPTTNGPFATGDGVRLGMAIGAETVDLDQVQLHPTGFVDPADPNSGVKFLAPEALRGVGGIMLDHRGQRFVDELATRDTVSHKMLHHCVHSSPSKHPALDIRGGSSHTVAHLILTQEAVDAFGAAAAGFYFFKKLLRKYDTLAELCEREGLPLVATERTLKTYGRSGNPDPYGKTRFPVLFAEGEGESLEVKSPLYASMVVPVLHYCMGGLKFDSQAHILGPDGAPIPGLFGAGEVTGGLHGGNRLAGNSLLECVVFGRIAGQRAFVHVLYPEAQTGAGEAKRDEL